MAEQGLKWYVLRAVSGKENKVKDYLEAACNHNDVLKANLSQVLIPTEKVATLRNGKRVEKEKNRLPGYVFVEANLVGDMAHMLRFTPNVLGFLGGMDDPTPVPQSDINRMLGAAEESELKASMEFGIEVFSISMTVTAAASVPSSSTLILAIWNISPMKTGELQK